MRIQDPSSSHSCNGSRSRDVRGQPLTLARVPGVIAQLQGFRGTVCSVREVEALRRLVNAEVSPAYKKLEASYSHVIGDVPAAIRGLHWKDFEVLVDLAFRQLVGAGAACLENQ